MNLTGRRRRPKTPDPSPSVARIEAEEAAAAERDAVEDIRWTLRRLPPASADRVLRSVAAGVHDAGAPAAPEGSAPDSPPCACADDVPPTPWNFFGGDDQGDVGLPRSSASVVSSVTGAEVSMTTLGTAEPRRARRIPKAAALDAVVALAIELGDIRRGDVVARYGMTLDGADHRIRNAHAEGRLERTGGGRYLAARAEYERLGLEPKQGLPTREVSAAELARRMRKARAKGHACGTR